MNDKKELKNEEELRKSRERDVFGKSIYEIKNLTGLELSNVEKGRLMEFVRKNISDSKKISEEIKRKISEKEISDKEKRKELVLEFGRASFYRPNLMGESVILFLRDYYGIEVFDKKSFLKLFPEVKNKKGEMVASELTKEYFRNLQEKLHKP